MLKDTILRMGHPTLRRRAKEVSDVMAPDIQKLVQKMFDAIEGPSVSGLAAPQINESLRIVIFQINSLTAERKGIDVIPPMLLINPEVKPLGTEKCEDWEACLSLEGLMGLVSRFKCVTYKGLNEKGKEISGEAEGYHARVLQHEIDHLDGTLYIDRMKDLKNLIFRDQYENWLEGNL